MKGTFCPGFSSTHGRMCVYGRYAPAPVEPRSQVLSPTRSVDG